MGFYIIYDFYKPQNGVMLILDSVSIYFVAGFMFLYINRSVILRIFVNDYDNVFI